MNHKTLNGSEIRKDYIKHGIIVPNFKPVLGRTCTGCASKFDVIVGDSSQLCGNCQHPLKRKD